MFSRRPKKLFDDAANRVDIYGIAMELAGAAYKGHKEMWDHVQSVERRMIARFQGHVSEETLKIYRAAAVLHDFAELKRETGKILPNGKKERVPVFSHDEWTSLMLTYGLPQSFVDTIDAMTIRPNEPYLNYIQRLSRDPLARTIKLYGDLFENRSGHRPAPVNPSAQLIDKKAYLYEMAEFYLEARRQGLPDMSVAEFIMTSRHVPTNLKNRSILQRYSSIDTRVPVATYGFWGEGKMRRFIDGLPGILPASASRVAL